MSGDTIDWIRLANAWINVTEYRRLAARFGTVRDVTRQAAVTLESAGLNPTKARALADPDPAAIDRGTTWLDADSNALLPFTDARYPVLLGNIPDPPLVLYVHGDPDCLGLPALALVGSRNPTDGGRRNAHDFAFHLAAGGFCIVSGMAQGIDSAAHRGALKAGAVTVAVLGHGVDRIYPAGNRELAREIVAANGALVSEFALGAPPSKHHFPLRNRIISGMSLGTVVIEAAQRSGSLITARLAGEQGREVFALPGSIHNPLARGCHRLIRQGAKLVETTDDIVAEVGPLAGRLLTASGERDDTSKAAPEDEDDGSELDEYLSHDPVTIDELIARSGLTIDQVSSILLILELKGKVERLAGGRYALIS